MIVSRVHVLPCLLTLIATPAKIPCRCRDVEAVTARRGVRRMDLSRTDGNDRHHDTAAGEDQAQPLHGCRLEPADYSL